LGRRSLADPPAMSMMINPIFIPLRPVRVRAAQSRRVERNGYIDRTK
jgi:hypothetical protein